MREKGMTLEEVALYYALLIGFFISLGMYVSGRLIDAFTKRSGGNALFLRELVTAAREEGRLARRPSDDVWTLAGDPPISRGIRELVAARLGELPLDQRAALEVIAAGEPARTRGRCSSRSQCSSASRPAALGASITWRARPA